MKLALAFLAVACTPVALVNAAYIPERASAMQLFTDGNYQAAATAFAALADDAFHEEQQADYLSKQALCLQRLQLSTQAMSLAQSITSVPFSKASQLELLRERKMWEQIVSTFASEDIELWPEKLVYPAFLGRANAFKARGFIAEAELDYVSAVYYTASPLQRASAFYSNGEMFETRDTQKALYYYGEVLNQNVRSGGTTQRSLTARARLFIGIGQFTNAWGEIDALIAFGSSDPHWKCMIKLVSGEISQAEGDLSEAAIFYQAAIDVPNAPAGLVSEARAKLNAIQTP